MIDKVTKKDNVLFMCMEHSELTNLSEYRIAMLAGDVYISDKEHEQKKNESCLECIFLDWYCKENVYI